LAAGIADPTVAEVYGTGVPFVARFVTVELHPKSGEVAKGIGRVVPDDPPPRFGEKYGKRLKSTDVRQEAGEVLEQLIFRGFAVGAAANAVNLDAVAIVDIDTRDWWRRFVGSIAGHYGDVVESGAMDMDPHRGTMAAIVVYLLWPAYQKYTRFFGNHRLAKRGADEAARAMTYPFYFLAAGWSLFSGHTNLRERRMQE
jgi:hypothetical protein